MTDQKSDQAALTGLVDDFGWEWQSHDLAINKDRDKSGESPLLVVTRNDIEWIKTHDNYDKYYPLAGTWVEGRLREEMGEAFIHLEFDGQESYQCKYWITSKEMGRIKPGYTDWWKSPVTALVATLRVLKQKEVT